MKTQKNLLVVDGNSLLNRAFYAIKPLTNSAGLYTHAVYGFTTSLQKHLEAYKPDYAVVAFDMAAPTFRHELYEAYKATRKGMPDELAVQLPYAKKVAQALGFTLCELPGWEADDILGTLATESARDPELLTYLATGDRDAMQLITENVRVLYAKTRETVEYDRERFIADYGMPPEHYADAKALMGDTSDNIPGIKGVGEKTATKLIAAYGTLENLYSKLPVPEVSASINERLAAGREQAFLSRRLALISREVPLPFALEEARYTGGDRQALLGIFTELEFTSLIDKMGLRGEAPTGQESGRPLPSEPERLDGAALAALDAGKVWTVGLLGEDMIVASGDELYACPAAESAEFFIMHKISAHDTKALRHALEKYKITEINPVFDTLLAAYVADSGASSYEPVKLSDKYLGSLPASVHLCTMADLLREPLERELRESGQEKLFYELELPLAEVLYRMERAGFKIDRAGIERFSAQLAEMAQTYAQAIYDVVGFEFNLNSPKQLGEVLFEHLGLPSGRRTKTGWSTDAETLERLRPYSEVVSCLLEYRHVTKLRSTYTEGLLAVADERGRVHTSFKQTVAATGRLSSTEPNLQNIPIRTELGRELRKYFIPEDGYVLIGADYSQIELRLLADISGDENMTGAFLRGDDIHTLTASKVFGVPEEQVTPELRNRAKAVNFGIVYGIGDYSLSQDLRITRREAAEYIEGYFRTYPKVREYLQRTVAAAHEQGFVTTRRGRRRYIPELAAKKKQLVAFGERVAMNSPIQGEAADIIKSAMIDVDRALREAGLDARLILQVHDELLVEAHESCAERAAEILRDKMEHAANLTVPLVVETATGKTWYEV